jgi:hypothetical protein
MFSTVSGALAGLGFFRLLTGTRVDVNLVSATIVATSAAGIVGIYTLLYLSAGPLSMTVDANGLTLLYARKRVRQFDFADPGTRVKLEAYGPQLRDGTPLPPPHHFVWGGIPLRSALTPEAYTAILRVADLSRWKIDQREIVGSNGEPVQLTTLSSPTQVGAQK